MGTLLSQFQENSMKRSNIRIYVGCGQDRRDGFFHADVRALDGIDFVCNAWELSNYAENVKEIYSRHMLEHLTIKEAELTLSDWFHCLSDEGTLYLVVPNLDFHIQQWLDADWSENESSHQLSNANYALGGLFGWQRECDPSMNDYNNTYWDVHKSGYNKHRLKMLLENVGFHNVRIQIKSDVHLVAMASKFVDGAV